MTNTKECVAGFGHVVSVWFHFTSNQFTGCTLESPEGCERLPLDNWFQHHMLILRTTRAHAQKSVDVLPYLTFVAGDRAVRAIRDYNVYELAIAFTSHYGWQLINGAKILNAHGELAKVYAGIYAVYLFRSKTERDAAQQKVETESA